MLCSSNKILPLWISEVKSNELLKKLKLKFFPSDFTQTGLLESVLFFSSLSSSNNSFASELTPLKSLIIFDDFESVLMLLSSSSCFSPWSLIAFNCFSFLPSIFFSLFKSPSFLSSSFFFLLKIYSMENTLRY